MSKDNTSCVVENTAANPADYAKRATATKAAREFITEIEADHGEILFHQSGGCCDGSSPMCYPIDDFKIGESDICLGEIDGAKIWISGPQFSVWKHTQLILDVVPGRGGMFSLDNGRERRFLSRARVFSEDELDLLKKSDGY